MTLRHLSSTFSVLGVCIASALFACSGGSGQADGGADVVVVDRTPPPVDDGAVPPVAGPDRLSDTGLYSDFASRTLAPGVIAYTPRYSTWTDGATAKRYLQLPAGEKIDTSGMDDWVFPVGTKAWKEFTLNGTVVETRMLWKKPEGWFQMAFQWQPDGSDALAAPDGVDGVLGTLYAIPTQDDCGECHDDARDMLLGVSALQLGASDGDGTLSKLAQAGSLTNPPAGAFDVPGTGAVKDALGYLHVNCGSCHSNYGAMRFQSELRLRLLVSDKAPEDTGAYKTAPFLAMKHVIPPEQIVYTVVPGNPAQSGLPMRMGMRNPAFDNPWAMPPVGTNIVDDVGVATINQWIAGMPCGGGCASAPLLP